MNIQKRNGRTEAFQKEKIELAILAAFQSNQTQIEKADLDAIISDITLSAAQAATALSVELIQDMVEEKLMRYSYFQEAKKYILYRQQRTAIRETNKKLANLAKNELLVCLLEEIQRDFSEEQYALSLLLPKFQSFVKEQMTPREAMDMLIKATVEMVSQEAPKWEMIAGRFLNFKTEQEIKQRMRGLEINTFFEKLRYLTTEGYYGNYMLEAYQKEEIEELANYIRLERNYLLTYSGMELLVKRYLIRNKQLELLESIQEMFMGIAMHLAIPEGTEKVGWAKQIYDILSTLQVTMATPTISNARKPYHQLSSCFIDTVGDSLEGIYRSIDNFAQISKFGGGMGLYFGKVRAIGSTIRGFQGAAGGVIRWIKLVNDTAIAVDQLGMRQGAAAVYLDVWHKDLPEFLSLKTNNGDDRMKAHDIFPAVCYPDLFWQLARDDKEADWHLMCPHEILQSKGYALEDYYGAEWEKRYQECVADASISKRTIKIKELIRLILKSAVETGTPFAFNRDHVNRLNPNPHAGIIYCSNLCTEIAQNMSSLQILSKEIVSDGGDTVVVEQIKPGDFVVCNLASLVLGNLPVQDRKQLRQIIQTVVRALDNVISLNYYPVPYAKITNQQYRAIGLGTSGYHHLLAKEGIAFESEQHLAYMDQLFEDINYYAIEASMEIAKQKGTYAKYQGSDWQTGEYFEKRSYRSERWQKLRHQVKEYGMRNGYVLAIAPTSSTSIIAGTTAAIDPILSKFFLEEKKGSMIARVAPDLSPQTTWLYKGAHLIDQKWVIKAAGIRQKHIDQTQSVNLYITNDYTLNQILQLYIHAWEQGLKTLYYVRSKSLEVEECESCAA